MIHKKVKTIGNLIDKTKVNRVSSVYLILYIFFIFSCSKDSCKKKPQNLFCQDVWTPVCGCDGETYSNPCYATRAGVAEYSEGTCD